MPTLSHLRPLRWRALLLSVAAIAALGIPPRLTATQSAPAAELTLRIIIVGTQDEAQRVLERLRAGAPFDTLAREVSIDPTADQGGLLGTVTLSALRPELGRALGGLGPGQITPIVAVPTGFAVLQVVVPPAANDPTAAVGRVTPAVAATGSVKYVFNVSGFNEAQTSLRDFPKPPDWNLDPRTFCQMRLQSVAAAQASLEGAIREAAGAPSPRLMHAHFALGQLYAWQGRLAEAIGHFEQARRIIASATDVGAEDADIALQFEQALGVARLHKAQMDNGVFHKPGDRCLFGAHGLRPLADPGESAKAVDHFLAYLARKPAELEVRWSLNLAYMLLGGYPAQVPAAQLIAPASFAAGGDMGRFVDVAPDAGLVSFSMAGGLIVDDFDNDGRFDLVTSSMDACGAMRLFMRTPEGPFVERGVAAGLGDQLGGLNTMQTDYDNDGCLDILLLRGGWDAPQRKSLLKNSCKGTFTDVTVASGLGRPATSTQTAVWTDIDRDGFLDLFVGNENTAAQLFLNQRDGTFTDIAQTAGVARTAFTKAVAAGDYDNDGWPDLYVSNFNGRNFLYRNRGDRTFVETADTAGVPGPGKGFGAWFFDYDNDGWQDLFATSYFTSVDEAVRTWLRLPHAAQSLKLYRNLRNGRFEDVTTQAGLDKVLMPMGSNFGDIDNDGWLDIFLGMGNPSYASTLPSVLLRNDEGRRFVDVTAAAGTGELHKGHGVAFADLDNDGDEEIAFEIGGATPGDAHALRLFENPGHGRASITVKLVGVKSNRAAIGARIAVRVTSAGGGARVIHRTVGSGGSFGASPLAQHVGLGSASGPVDVEVWWPDTNTRHTFTQLPINQAYEITEFGSAATRLARPPLRLGRGRSSDDARAR
jgi:hypothetical protein